MTAKLRALAYLLAVGAACVSCHREAKAPRTAESAALPKTNVVSRLDEQGRPSETLVYATNGLLQQRTVYVTAADGRILTARTADGQGQPKWTDQYTYGETSDRRPVQIRRLRANGQIIAMRFVSSPDGTQRRLVTGPDGRQIPEAEQAAFLEE